MANTGFGAALFSILEAVGGTLLLDIPPTWGYLIYAVVVITLVPRGVSAISRLQMCTQPLWLIMLVVPFGFVMVHDPATFAGIMHYAGELNKADGFNNPITGS